MPAPFVWPSRIRFVDTDASLRIHYTALFRHFEAAEDEFLRLLGLPYSSLETQGISFPRVHVEADYLAPLLYDDQVSIQVHVDRVGTSSFTLAFHMYKQATLAAKGSIVIVSMDRHTGKSTALPDHVAEALRQSRTGPA